MNSLGATILCTLLLVVFFAPPRWALIAIAAGVLYLPISQQVSFLGFNLFAMRFLEVAGFLRVLISGKLLSSKLNGIDRAVLLLYAYRLVVYLFRGEQGVAYEFGIAIDAYFCYFIFRTLFTSIEDFQWFLRKFIYILGPFALLTLIESFTSQNQFAVMGGGVLGEEWYRNDRIRVVASFLHPSLLGTLGGSFLPVYIGMWFRKKGRMVGSIGIVLCLAIVWASNSGGPASCAVVGFIGWGLWTMRTRMWLFRRLLVSGLLLLAVTMKAPIWYLLQKISDLTGGDGWHRSYLLDISFQNLGQWWLIGMPIMNTVNWFPYLNGVTHAADIANQYLVFGLAGGLGAMFLLILVIKRAFSELGNALRILRSKGKGFQDDEFLIWGLAVLLAVHTFNWFGISYFDQTYVVWFLHLAVIRNLSERVIRSKNSSTQLHLEKIPA